MNLPGLLERDRYSLQPAAHDGAGPNEISPLEFGADERT
jgi:hypothetical protein